MGCIIISVTMRSTLVTVTVVALLMLIMIVVISLRSVVVPNKAATSQLTVQQPLPESPARPQSVSPQNLSPPLQTQHTPQLAAAT